MTRVERRTRHHFRSNASAGFAPVRARANASVVTRRPVGLRGLAAKTRAGGASSDVVAGIQGFAEHRWACDADPVLAGISGRAAVLVIARRALGNRSVQRKTGCIVAASVRRAGVPIVEAEWSTGRLDVHAMTEHHVSRLEIGLRRATGANANRPVRSEEARANRSQT